MPNIAWFISPHGFGHAARACAVMQSLANQLPVVHFEIFTTVPEWFFTESLTCSYQYNRELVDIGLVQSTPLVEDLDATLRALYSLYPLSKKEMDRTAGMLASKNCCLVVCDISPFGIGLANHSGIPSILIENFTWDWIYEGYLNSKPEFSFFIEFFSKLFMSSTHRIQTEPLCNPMLVSEKILPPISRKPKTPPSSIRERLGITDHQKMVLLTMGGINDNLPQIGRCIHSDSIVMVVPGAVATTKKVGNLILLPHHSDFYHPDLLHASDAVISKLGYSTIAEAYYAGAPFGYIRREHFRESPVLEKFTQQNLPSLPFLMDDLSSPSISIKVDELLSLSPLRHQRENGADQAAKTIISILSGL